MNKNDVYFMASIIKVKHTAGVTEHYFKSEKEIFGVLMFLERHPRYESLFYTIYQFNG